VLLSDLKNVRLVNASLAKKAKSAALVINDISGKPLGGESQIVNDTEGERGDTSI